MGAIKSTPRATRLSQEPPMSSRHHPARNPYDFVQLLRDVMEAFAQLGRGVDAVGSPRNRRGGRRE